MLVARQGRSWITWLPLANPHWTWLTPLPSSRNQVLKTLEGHGYEHATDDWLPLGQSFAVPALPLPPVLAHIGAAMWECVCTSYPALPTSESCVLETFATLARNHTTILSNQGDSLALAALADYLSLNEQAEAAHICYPPSSAMPPVGGISTPAHDLGGVPAPR
ncbi:hypothetical protein FRC06_011498 [Ceratobasidium sp. 370]|nr:hypothetical protein FRC06_011498 [Ceratobasidium sp. 370]